jgi:hypothetical protein
MKSILLRDLFPKSDLFGSAFWVGNISGFRQMNFAIRENGKSTISASFNLRTEFSLLVTSVLLRRAHAFAHVDDDVLIQVDDTDYVRPSVIRNVIRGEINTDRNRALIDNLEAHLTGGAGDDAEGGFVIARVEVFGLRFHDVHDLFASDSADFDLVRLL